VTARTRPHALLLARRRDVEIRRDRVRQALAAMQQDGSEISISSVATRARVHRSFIHRHTDVRADVYAAVANTATSLVGGTVTRGSVEADNLNLRETVRRQVQHITELETRLSELIGERAYARTGLGAPSSHVALQEQVTALQVELQDLRATLQSRDEELGAAREVHRQLMTQLNMPNASSTAMPSVFREIRD
jgi:chromosome segregation ATPase